MGIEHLGQVAKPFWGDRGAVTLEPGPRGQAVLDAWNPVSLLFRDGPHVSATLHFVRTRRGGAQPGAVTGHMAGKQRQVLFSAHTCSAAFALWC